MIATVVRGGLFIVSTGELAKLDSADGEGVAAAGAGDSGDGVAAAGEAGAARALEIFHEEIRRNMALLGVSTIAELGPQYLKFIDTTLRPRSRAQLRAVDDARALAEA